MGQSLTVIAQTLRDADKKVQLIYAFNGSDNTCLFSEYKQLIAPKELEQNLRHHVENKYKYNGTKCHSIKP
jgi:hypothetical protein